MYNASFPNVIGDNTPASLSSVMIEDELRGVLGFDGIVISGALNEGAITEYYTSDQAAVMAVKAGADMVFLPEDFETAYNGLLEAVNSGEISENRINESLSRIYSIKYADRVEEITKGS
jgi:beta-N-acetylhexosaminidase